MKKVRVEDAVGMTLCHDLTEMRDGFKGAAYKRGHVITEADIPHMLDIGKRTVFVWEENAGEIHEEDAALRIFRELAVTVPLFASAANIGIRQRSTVRMMAIRKMKREIEGSKKDGERSNKETDKG